MLFVAESLHSGVKNNLITIVGYTLIQQQTTQEPHSNCLPIVQLVCTMWHIFSPITWTQRNAILHEKAIGTSVKWMNSQLHHIYKFCPTTFETVTRSLHQLHTQPRPSSTPKLPPYTYLVQMALHYPHRRLMHKTIKCLQCLQRDPLHTIDSYFTHTTTPQHTSTHYHSTHNSHQLQWLACSGLVSRDKWYFI